jgi:hypothetical protein
MNHSPYFYLFIITVIAFLFYIYNNNKAKDPTNWRGSSSEEKNTPYSVYKQLVVLFGKPDAIDVNADGFATWDEKTLSEFDLIKGDKIIRIEIRDEPTGFVRITFRNPNNKEVMVQSENLNGIIASSTN